MSHEGETMENSLVIKTEPVDKLPVTTAETKDDYSGKDSACISSFDEKNKIKNEPEINFVMTIHDDGKFNCDICLRSFIRKVNLCSHMRTHQKGFFCKKCKKYFRRKSSSKAHKCQKIQCSFCGKEFSRRDNLNQHIDYVHREWSESDFFTCDYCNKGFKYLKSIECHMKQHMKEKPLICSACGKGFSVKNTYRQHLLTHAEKLPCKLCGKRLKASAMYYHVKSVHETERKFKCTKCASSFKVKADLKSHMQHHDTIPWCKICDELASKPFKLGQHLLHHLDPTAFMCPICSKNFARKDTLKIHLQNVHKSVN